ncbi:FecCD family ABC transporter permease [Streptoalloteichus hindustanus]|uniref:Iron complex transport system permease protein n=1 Tax=Streptoalloteichus hindustanus TaxID=2017 RepID=A0A1M5FKF7_STRHI|nr:iron chelate uptake ABC transporter family permease subunit [Streptoalloteichus hindustanus]SHF91986.1 iron complex transport system permease protein [Streptoalloteichus hindustanus]
MSGELRAGVLRTGPVALRFSWRAVVVGVALVAVTTALSVVAIAASEPTLDVSKVVLALVGQGDYYDWLVVTRFQLPRALTAVLVGLALGAAGAVFQSLSRNPLGSPDIAGFGAGASTGAVLQIIVFGGGTAQIALGCVFGGLATALLVYLLAYRAGLQGYRLVLVGIGINAVLSSLNRFLLSAADLNLAQQAQVWLTGTLNARGWPEIWPVAVAVAVALPVLGLMGARMRLIEMDDELARSLGVPLARTRAALLVLGTVLTAAATATAGPIAFIALAAPQLARRLTGAASVGVVPSALMGAALLALSDLLAQRVTPGGQLPVGVFTAAVGGGYLVWLLVRANRRRRR